MKQRKATTGEAAAAAVESGGLGRSLDRIFRTALILVPVGVIANLALSWLATDHSVLRNLGQFQRKYLYLAILLALVPWFTNALRLLVWTRFVGYPIKFRDTFRITLGSELASSVLPTSSGGEVFRWGMMVQRGITQGQAASIVTLGYLEDLVFFATALPVAFVLSNAWDLPFLQSVGSQFQDVRGRAVMIAILLFVVGLSLRFGWRAVLTGALGRRVRRTTLRWSAGFRRKSRKTRHDFRGVWRMVVARGKLRFLLTFVITAVQWSARYSVATAIAYFFGAPVDPLLFFLLQWVIFTAMMFVPTPGASGGAEAAFVLVYSALLPSGVIGIATAVWRLLTFYFQLTLGSIIFFAMNIADARGRVRERRRARAAGQGAAEV